MKKIISKNEHRGFSLKLHLLIWNTYQHVFVFEYLCTIFFDFIQGWDNFFFHLYFKDFDFISVSAQSKAYKVQSGVAVGAFQR